MSFRNNAALLGLCAATTLAIAGCASTPPPKELLDARQAYDHARDSAARELVPAQLLAAQQALGSAEQSFADQPDAQRTRDLAYIAQRKAQTAEAQGLLAADQRDKARAQADIERIRQSATARTQAALSQSQQENAAQRQMLAAQGQQLTAEQRARGEAERRARDAIASLEKIAAVKEEARGLVITLNGGVLFATGESALLPIARDRLDEVARALKDNPYDAIVVEGHTDAIGSQQKNDELSRQRAESVRDYLIGQGVEAGQIRAVGIGSRRPVADNKSPEGRANNRRVEIIVDRKRGAP
jgi:outer membrane protein OmpA-like peptidoglycan-associated protein